MDSLRVLFAGGGTGGHLFPAIAIADEIRRRRPDADILFVGRRQGLEDKVVPLAGYSIWPIRAQGLPRRLSLGAILFMGISLLALLQSVGVIARYKPSLVVGTGGYVSGPIALAAWLFGIPVVIQEQNSFPGLTTRLLAKIARQVYLAYPQSLRYFSKSDKLIVSGNPTRNAIGTVTKRKAAKRFSLDPSLKTVLIIGGSQGAHKINQAFLEALDRILEAENLQVIWQTGREEYQSIRSAVAGYGPAVIVFDFIDDMASAFGAADIVVARSGATTIAEITRCGLPSILIPYPYATGRHQELNAQTLHDSGAAIVIPDHRLNGPELAQTLIRLLSDEVALSRMANRSRSLGHPEATDKIVDCMVRHGLLPEDTPVRCV